MLEVLRCVTDEDERVSLGIYNAVWPHESLTMEDVQSFKASVRDYADFLAYLDGACIGDGVAAITPQRSDRVFAIVTVDPVHRHRGAGTALYQAISAWAAERGLADLEVPVADNDPESLGFAQRRGFTEERREIGVVLRLAGMTPPPVQPPDGVTIVTWAERPELARGMYEVALEAEPDIPGSEDVEVEPFDDWLEHDMRGPGDRPEATFIALAGAEVVGYAKFSLTGAQPTVAHHDLSAVKRAWRGRGIAGALKAAQITWAIANGYEELRTRNEERNEPIRRLNARLGYQPGIGRIYLTGPLAGPPAEALGDEL
jgi:GNAT superfamily N-acetyltransferase